MTTRPFPLQPKPIHVADEQLADLNTRLRATRWPLDARNDDWYYGVSKTYLKDLADYWADALTGVSRNPP
jgi:Epoxide hydrolase N terminus